MHNQTNIWESISQNLIENNLAQPKRERERHRGNPIKLILP